jgi:hypothetical protein
MQLKKFWRGGVRKGRDALALICLLLICHGVGALGYVISNLFPYYQAVLILAGERPGALYLAISCHRPLVAPEDLHNFLIG